MIGCPRWSLFVLLSLACLCRSGLAQEDGTGRQATATFRPMAVSPDGRYVATVSDDGTVVVSDARSGARLHTIGRAPYWVLSLAFSPDGSTLAVSALPDGLFLWDVAAAKVGRVLARPNDMDPATAVAFSPDGRSLAVGGATGYVKLLDSANGAPLRVLAASGPPVNSVAFSPDGQSVAAGGGRAGQGIADLWDAASGQHLRDLPVPPGAVQAVAFSPDGRTLATGGSGGGAVQLWHPGTGEFQNAIDTGGGNVQALSYSRAGDRLAAASSNGNVTLTDPRSGAIVARDPGTSPAVALSPDGGSLIRAGSGSAPPVTVATLPPNVRGASGPPGGATGGARPGVGADGTPGATSADQPIARAMQSLAPSGLYPCPPLPQAPPPPTRTAGGGNPQDGILGVPMGGVGGIPYSRWARNDAQYRATLADARGLAVAVFTSDHDRNAKTQRDAAEAAARRYQQVAVIQASIEECPQAAAAARVQFSPTTVLYRGGAELARAQGLQDASALGRLIEQHAQ